jgi:hypothetical protein
MFIRLRVRLKLVDNTPIAKPPSYPFRITSFIISLAVHCALIASIALISTDDDKPIRAFSTDLRQLQVRKVLIYDIRRNLPDVTPLKSSASSPKPQGAEVSKQAVIATSPNAKSTEQFIWQPVPKIQIKHDLRAPDVIARMARSLPSPPVPPKERKPPKQDVDGVKAAQENNSPQQPKGDVNHAKVFVPPPPHNRQPQLPLQTPVLDDPSPAVAALARDLPLPFGSGAPVFTAGFAPPPTAPPASAANSGDARIDIAIASLHPNSGKSELPEGERPGQFSKAPAKRAPSTGELNGSASVKVPNLTIREDRTKPAQLKEDKANLKTILYAEKVRSVNASTLSVPLRPSSRSIPRAVDARFQSRNVYTMVIPIENLPAYSGDWILWFVEKEPKSGETPVMRAPVPFRKLEPVDQPVSANSAGERVQILGILQKDGKLDGITVLVKAGPAVEQAVIRDAASWEFRPATRNGVPIAVEVVIEIPFVYPSALAKRAQP